MTFDELSTLKQPSASLRTALDKISAALGSVGDAGQQARSVVDELRVSLRAAAAQSVKSARSLAKFDEINRLSAPAEDKTAALEKQQKAAEAAAKAEKAARSTAARRSGTAGSDLSGLTAVWQSVRERVRGGVAKISAGWAALSTADCAKVLNATAPDSMTVQYFFGGVRTAKMYAGDRTADLKAARDGQAVWEVAVNLIEF